MLASALAECFLKKMRKSNYIRYEDGADNFDLAKDEVDQPPPEGATPLKQADPKLERRYDYDWRCS